MTFSKQILLEGFIGSILDIDISPIEVLFCKDFNIRY